jgi:hypothetical protein
MGWFSDALTVLTALIMPELLLVVKLVTTILEKLGLIDAGEDAKEVGDKMLQAEEKGITPDNYENYDDYNKAIKEFELDPEKSAQFTDQEKFAKYAAVGLGQIEKVVGDGAITFLTEVATKLSPEFKLDTKIQSYMDSFSGNLDKLNGYFNGSLSQKDFQEVEKQVVSIEKEISPEKSNDEILSELDKERGLFEN